MPRSFCPLLSLIVFVLLVIFGRNVSLLPSIHTLTPSLAVSAVLPADDEWYLGYYYAGCDHLSLFHNFGDLIDSVRGARILLCGNSRMLFAVDQEELRAFEKRTGLSCYVLAFQGERHEFLESLVERYDLRPRWIVVHADTFFEEGVSNIASKAIRGGEWEARKIILESNAAFRVHRVLEKWIPHLDLQKTKDSIYFRSKVDGAIWVSGTKGDAPTSIDQVPREWELTSSNISVAERFQSWLKLRGTETILTVVPPSTSGPLMSLSEKTRMPFILPDVHGLTTYDGSHLDRVSAAKFSHEFFLALEESIRSH